MQPDLRVVLFAIVVAYVFITAFNFLVVGLYHRIRGTRPTHSRSYLITSRIGLAIAFVGFVCVLYGYFIEPRWVEVTHVEIRSPKIAKETGRVRIVQISDLHSAAKPLLEPRLPGLIAAEKPDLIVYTGDSLQRGAGFPVFRKLITDLSKIAPVYATAGNWDVATEVIGRLYQDTSVVYLEGRNVKQDVRGTPIWIAGIAQWHDDQVWPSMRGIPRSDFGIFLFHYPDGILEIANEHENIDLYLAGHTHGGQIALPFYGALTTNSIYDKRFEAGLYKVKNTWLYVNRGIGMTYGAPRVRFLARPEITVIDLVPQS
ncbi:MAG TPA: metallophosphoesterase [Terriglobales bacterium]|nr:metallophosphoesterase [Terriglobales bacterium]